MGKDKNSFSKLVNNTASKVTFGIKTNGKNQFSIRMILRHGDNKIREDSVVPTEGKTIAETITQNMKLKALSSE